jgi:hypothetical protein
MANTSNLDLVKPAGTDHALISVINSNMDKVDAYAGKVNTSLAGVEDGMAIVATGNTHAAITAGQFVYVKEHNTLPEGLYTASSNIAANATLSTTNLTADSKGGLNALSDQIGTLNSNITNLIKYEEISVSTTRNNYVAPYEYYGNTSIPFATIPSTAIIIGTVITGGNVIYGSVTIQKSSTQWGVHLFTGREVTGATVRIVYK